MIIRLVSGSALLRIIGALAQLGLTLTVSYAYSPAEAGLFFFGFSILAIISAVSRLGSELSGLREASILFSRGEAAELKAAVDARVIVTLIASVILGAGLAAVSESIGKATFGHAAVSTVLVVAATVPAMAFTGLMSEILKGLAHQWLGIFLQNVSLPVVAVLVIWGLQASAWSGSPSASVAVLVASWLSAGASVVAWLYLYRKRVKSRYGLVRASRSRIASVLREAPTLVVVSTASIIMQWVGSVLLGFLSAADQVAGYSVAMRLSIAVSIIHSAAASVVAPRMSVAHSRSDLDALRRVSHSTSMLLAGLTWPVLVLMMALAPEVMGLFGPEYREFAGVLRILLLGQLVAAFCAHSGMVLVMCGHYRSARLNSLTSVLALAIYSAALIPALGVNGAALASATAVITGHLQAIVLVRRHVGIWTTPTRLDDIRACAPRIGRR